MKKLLTLLALSLSVTFIACEEKKPLEDEQEAIAEEREDVIEERNEAANEIAGEKAEGDVEAVIEERREGAAEIADERDDVAEAQDELEEEAIEEGVGTQPR